MHIYFDLDGTIVDEKGERVRPGLCTLFEMLIDDGHQLSLWTASTEERARQLLDEHGLTRYFQHTVFREDYDPLCEGYSKDIRYQDGDLLIDDDLDQIAYVHSIGKHGHCIRPYHTDVIRSWTDDSLEIYDEVSKISKKLSVNAKKTLSKKTPC